MISTRHLVTVGILMELCYGLLYAADSLETTLTIFIAVNATVYVLLALVVWRCSVQEPDIPSPKATLALIFGFGMLFRLTLVPHPPVASDDIYRYLWDGRVAAHGINPYALPPQDPHLAALTTPDLPSRVNFPWLHSIYPPLAQVLFTVSAFLFGPSATGFKLLVTGLEAFTMLVLVRFITRFSLKPWLLLLYAWSPVPVMYYSLDGHIDALGIPFLMLFLYLVMTMRYAASGIVLGFSALAKFYPLFVVPFLIRVARRAHTAWLPLIPLALLGIGYVAYYEPSGGLVNSLITFNAHWEFNAPVFSILLAFFKDNGTAHLASGLLFLAWLTWLFLADKPIGEKVFLAFVGFIILGPLVHPWYLGWLAAMLAVRWSTAVFLLLGLSNLSNIVVYRYHTGGGWTDDPLLMILEYVPFFALFIWELTRGVKSGVVFSTETPGLSNDE
jgi:alpha-1,6-mannosyltransferase